MLSPSHFTPGTVLWLPKQADIDPLDTVNAHHTVPEKCFGHPVLVLADDTTTNCISILILTSFAGGTKIIHRVRKRGHDLHDYMAIYPADPLVEGIPSLRLCSSQEFGRHEWVNVKCPMKCPKRWLQATWASVWKRNDDGRRRKGRIEASSLHALALYAMRMGFDPGVYAAMLKDQATPPESSLGHLGQPGPVRIGIDIPEEGYGTYTRSAIAAVALPPASLHIPEERYVARTPAVSTLDVHTVPAALRASLPLHASERIVRVHRIPPERQPLLPQSNPHRGSRRPAPSNPYRVYGAVDRGRPWGVSLGGAAGSRGSGPSSSSATWVIVIRCLKVVLYLAVTIGMVYGVYLGTCWAVMVVKHAVVYLVHLVGAAWAKIAAVAAGAWQGILGLGPQLRGFCERMVAWIKEGVSGRVRG